MSVPMSATKASLICILLALSLFVDILDANIKLQPPRPVGWNVAVNKPLSAPYPMNAQQRPLAYNPAAGSPGSLYGQHSPAGSPGLYPQSNAGYRPAGAAPGYPHQQQTSYGARHTQQPQYAAAPPQGYPAGAYPMQYRIPAGQQPVVNNFYGSPQHSQGGEGGGLGKTAVAGIVGSALYDALKPRSEEKTIINYHHMAALPAPTTTATPVSVTVKPNQTMINQLMPGNSWKIPYQPGQVPYKPEQVYYKPVQVPYQPYSGKVMVIVPLKPGDKTNAKLQAYGAVLTYIGVLFCIGVMVGFLKKLYFTKM